jgi:hypothetical protein
MSVAVAAAPYVVCATVDDHACSAKTHATGAGISRRLVLIALVPLELHRRPARKGATRHRGIGCWLHEPSPRDGLV